VVDLPGTAAPKTAQEVPALAFSWSPDGRTIAFLVPDMDAGPDPLFLDDEQALGVRLLCFDPATGRSWPVARFPPAPGTLGVIPFFDQYALSRTSWSPDGRSFVFSALSPDGRPGIYIVAADGSAPPSLLAPGDSASWSSR
jgi:Tol biopolymer transport system component